MEEQKVLYEVKDQIAWITLNRPEALNAVNREMVAAIVGYCKQANDDPNVQIVIFKANGERAFSVGGDVKDRARANAAASGTEAQSPLVLRQARSSGTPGTPAPVIAVHGYVVGTGLLMSLACDVRIAAEGARLGLSEVRLGFIPGSGGTQRMARLVGIPKALEICLSGELYEAQECHRIGLVNQVVPYDQLIPAGEKMAASFLKGAPLALRYIKEAIYKGSELSLDQGLRLESDLASMVLNTEDAKEGPKAFVEKRAPEWKGK
ncbi:MAG: Enoyl-CoA hydratase/isomerase family protein [Deltaproteobacteria bacterium]|nr:Enoyl-CoA hydratase/isomerase family protein [Deltaproteobacteria bacterium]